MRLLQKRIGDLLGKAQIGAHSTALEGEALTKNERHVARLMAAHRDVVEEVIAASTDDEPATLGAVPR